jgi:hypothetical protein
MLGPEQLIRERAYHLWMEEGCPDGRSDFHWHVAREQVLATLRSATAQAAPKARAKRATAAPRTGRPQRTAKSQKAAVRVGA